MDVRRERRGAPLPVADDTNTVFNDDALSRGFMVASASLNNNGTNANDVLAPSP